MEPKLRTVLWGWAGDQIPDTDLARLDALARARTDSLATDLAPLLTAVEVAAEGQGPHPAGHASASATDSGVAGDPVAGAVARGT